MKIPPELIKEFEYAYAAVHHGVYAPRGRPEDASGVTKEEALGIAGEFLTGMKEWLDASPSA